MPGLGLALSFRDSIQDPSVIEELDRAYARLNAVLRGMGQLDGEKGIQDGGGSGVEFTAFTDLSGPFILPPKKISLLTDTDALDPGESTVLRIDSQAAVTVGGIVGGRDGRILKIYSPRSALFALTMGHQTATADADRRMDLTGADDLASVVGQARGWTFIYDATDGVWVQDGGSAAIAVAKLKSLVQSGTQVGTDADTNEKTLWTANVPANTLTVDGDVVHVRAFGDLANNSQGKRLRFYWDGVVVADTAAQAWQDQGWQLHVMILRRGVGSQVVHAQFIPAIAGTSASPGQLVTDAADETAAVAFKITGTNSHATANDITFEGGHAFKSAAA